MILVTFYQRGKLVTQFTDEAGMAQAYADYAQLCGYAVEMEAL